MADVHEFISEVKVALAGVEERIRNHPYVAALEAGEIEKERLGVFAGEQYHIISSDVRSVALLLSRWGQEPGCLEFFWMLLQAEVEALKLILRLGLALGTDADGLRAYEPLAGAQAYKAYMTWLSQYGTEAEAAAAFLVNFPAWGANCRRISRALKEKYGLKSDEVAFFDLFATPAGDFEDKALAIIDKELSRGMERLTIKRAARLLQDYEVLFWDVLWEASTR